MSFIKKIFTPSTAFLSSYYDKARYLLAWRISLVFFSVFCLLLAIYSAVEVNVTQYIFLIFVIGVTGGSLLYLKIGKKFEALFWIYAIAGTVISNLAMNLVLDFTHYVDFLWIIAAVLVAFVGLGQKKGLGFLLVNAVFIGYFVFFTLNEHIVTLKPKTIIEKMGDYLEILTALFVITYLLYQYFVFNDYLRQKLSKANIQLEKKNNEKKVLVKEVHHRVKNNLQIIISLLRMQKVESGTKEEKMFDEAIHRIMSMSLIHKKLYQGKNLSELELKTYLQELVSDIQQVYDTNKTYHFAISSSKKMVGLKTVVPLGLLVNELVSNSYKHSVQNTISPTIQIDINELPQGYFSLIYNDFGEWKVPQEGRQSFGLELIETLTDQLEGTFEREGSTYIFKLKDLDLN